MSEKSAEDDILSRPQNEDEYNVFLCYNYISEEDKLIVKEIASRLKEWGIVPWLDIWEVRPGTSWQREKEKQIKDTPAAAVFVGQKGIGDAQLLETEMLLRELVERQCFVIPVYLPNASSKPELPHFLKGIRGVDFRDLDADEDPLGRLIWGITGKRGEQRHTAHEEQIEVPKLVHEMDAKIGSHVLVASLGESPIEISAMYDLLTEREKLTINQVIVLSPKSKDIERAYKLVKESLTNVYELQYERLPIEGVNRWIDACLVLKQLYILLNACQARGDTVYLSLTTGDKSMAALIASITPFFPCVRHLYHFIDPFEEHFLSIDELELDMTPSQRKSVMHPDLERLILVDIPLEPGQQIDEQFIHRLLTATEEELTKMQDEAVEKVNSAQAIVGEGKKLEALVTERVMGQFRKTCQQDRDAARLVRAYLEGMQYTVELRNFLQDSSFYNPAMPAKSTPTELHFFTSSEVPVRPVFYTRPNDICNALDNENEVEQVVICELDSGKEIGYRSLQEIVASPGFSIRAAYRLEKLPPVPDSVLIVPLDKTSMVATQLYTLLTYQEGHDISEVILVYPEQVTGIAEVASLIVKALREDANVPCIHAPVPDLSDIDSLEASQSYQAKLEKVIDQTRQAHPGCIIDLALSGGHEGMIAMTIFVAQKKQIPYVYHMLITDEQWRDDINQQMTVESLNGLSADKRNDRLFLRAYEGEGVYTKLVFFKIPVLPI